MQTLGITGSFGTGKTTVARLFAKFGAQVIDADKLAHKVIKKGSREYKKIVTGFGGDILKLGGEIDREKLARKVFGKSSALRKLVGIVHPAVIMEIKRQLARVKSRKQVVIIDAPLLIESGLSRNLDKLIVVVASRENQINRLKKKTELNTSQILQRIKAQLPLKNKVIIADFIIDNNGSLTYTKKQVKEIWQKLFNNKKGQ